MSTQVSEQGIPKRHARKSVHWRKDGVILARLPDVERRHLAGDTNLAIAAVLGVDESTIRLDLKRLAELWIERIKQDQETLRGAAVAELADVRRRALAAATFDEQAERAVLYGVDSAGNPVDVARDAKGGVQFRGNKAAALNVARQATMDQAKVLGIVVEKVEHGGTDSFLDALRRFAAGADGPGQAGPPADSPGAGTLHRGLAGGGSLVEAD